MSGHSASPHQTEMPYGLWRSPMAMRDLLSQPSVPMYPFRHHGQLHYLEALTREDGRIALMRQSRAGERRCLTPPAFNIRTRVHEYGGKCFCLLGDQLVFNNFSDGRIYRQDLSAHPDGAPPLPVTEAPGAGRTACFADLTPVDRLQAVIAVMESGAAGGRSRDALVLIDVAGEAARRGAGRPLVLVEGSDFYACPALSPDQSQLAWLEWDDPFMPWDQSRLVTAGLPGAPRKIVDRRVLVAGAGQAVCQAGFIDDHNLLFVSDSDRAGCDFWDVFRHTDGETRRITDDRYEYGEAHWVFGQRRWQRLSENTIAAVAGDHDGERLLEVMLDSGDTAPLAEDCAACDGLSVNAAGDELLWVARYAGRGAEIRSLDLTSGASEAVYRAGDTGDDAGPANIAYSLPQPLAYPTRDGQRAYAYFYPPANPQYRAPDGTRPPLLVMVHGGPTARATRELHPLKQFFATCGYAVLDVNHRGSTGYGRAYRQRLLGQWGEIDATDIADGIEHLAAEGRIDPGLVFIRGGSAGGYAVLRALTRFPRMFCGGACYYGIGNLITLAKITHRFEGCYTDRLIGETFDPEALGGDAPDPASRFVQRSPVFQMERLACPLILFQGLDDKVVPPQLSREVAECLGNKGIPYEYVEYENEGHGFRRLATRIDSLEKETEFFSAIIRAKGEQR